MSASRRFFRLPFVVAVLVLTSVCAGPFTPPPPPMGPEAYCASQLPDIGYGAAFYCPTSQANLANKVNFPDGSRGFCMYAMQNLSLVGYVAYTAGGGASYVTTQSDASSMCNFWRTSGGPGCPGVIRCTR